MCIGLLVGGVQPAFAAATTDKQDAAPSNAPTPDFGDPVPGRSATEIKSNNDPDSSTTLEKPAAIRLTPNNAVEVEVPESGGDGTRTEGAEGSSPAEVAGDWRPIEGQPLELATADERTTPPASVSVKVVDIDETDAIAGADFALEIARSDDVSEEAVVAVRIPRGTLELEYGADYANRLNWIQVPSTTEEAEQPNNLDAVPVASALTSDHIVLTPTVTNEPTLVMATASASASSGTGSYAATPLKSSSTWDVAEQTGGFSWDYDMPLPASGVGPQPSTGLSYSSQAVDGLTGSTNNQPSVVGEGWELDGAGFIERRYVPCSLDDGPSGAVNASGDLCWKTDNATISMAGHSGTLVKDTTSSAWRLSNDDGTRFERLQGTAQGCADNGTASSECWKMTTTDGTQYFFGLNRLPGWTTGKTTTNSTWTVPVYGNDPGEPCHASSFAASGCMQAWRWNLDYVVDTNGNAQTHFYTTESNKYAKNGSGATQYIRGGVISRIEYGLRSNNLFGLQAAGYKVHFSYDGRGRCSDSAGTTCTSQGLENANKPATPASYPDVPWDQLCTAAACAASQASPTFFTNARLTKVEAQVLVGGSYTNVDSWSFFHSFPAPGDGTSAALWLTKVQHTGSYAGQTPITEPATEFSGMTLQNRVWAVDGLVPLSKWRLSSVKSTLGAVTSVNYAPAQCVPGDSVVVLANPESNMKWCYPEWWVPQTPNPIPKLDLFHKYRIASVNVDAATGPALSQVMRTEYTYGTPRWRYNDSALTPANRRSWNTFAGVDTVEVREGDPSAAASRKVTKYWYYQGMNGDRANSAGGSKSAFVAGTSIPDERWFAGQVHRQQTLLGVGGAQLSETVTTPWASAATANNGSTQARMIRTAKTVTSEPMSTGGVRTLDTSTTFDSANGLPVTQSTTPSDGLPKCVTTTYAAPNTVAWIIGAPSEVRAVAKSCPSVATAQLPQDLISQERTAYDSLGWGAAPTRGLPTAKEAVDRFEGGQPQWASVSTSTYDALGRPVSNTDALGRTNLTAYAPAASLPLTSTTLTNTAPFTWTAVTAYEPTTGSPSSTTDPNGALTTVTVDALGRAAKVWLPLRPASSNPSSPSIAYEYAQTQTAPNSIKTTTYKAGTNVTDFELLDGLGRSVQTQSSASSGGSVIKTTAYDSQGRAYWTDNPYWTVSVNPSTSLFVPDSENAIPSQVKTTFDAAGRTTKVTTSGLGQERSSVTSIYAGADRVDTVPPSGDTPTSTFTNTLGQQTKLSRYLSATTTGTAQNTTYGYDKAGNLSSMTDPVGNIWSWTYDLRGYRISQTDPDSGTSTATYDNAGNMTSTTDARGQVATNTYDQLNRKIATYSGTTSGSLIASWTYDTVRKGLVTTTAAYTGSTPGSPGAAYKTNVGSYDAAGNVTRSTVSIPTAAPAFGGTTYTTTAGYYADSSPSVKNLPAMGGLPSEQILYSYDAWGRLSGVRGAGGILNSTVYTPIGQLSQFNRTNSGVEAYSTYGYDNVTGAILNIKDNAVFDGSGHYVADRVYTRDDAGNILTTNTSSVLPTPTTQVNCYSYDRLRQLTRVWTPASTAACATAPSNSALQGPARLWYDYAYDNATGNRTSTTNRTVTGATSVATYNYPAPGSGRPHAVNSVSGPVTAGGGSYAYDSAGNMTSRPEQSLTYNEMGRVSKITEGQATQTNIYDAASSLLLRVDSVEGATLFLGETVLSKSVNSTVVSAVRTYTGAQGLPVAERSARMGTAGTVVTWLFTDTNGTVDTQTVAASGLTTKQYRDPFGAPIAGSSGVWADGNGFLNKPANAATGLTTIGARTYDPVLGKFISVDPIVDPKNPRQNTGYAYSGNNPVTFSDPTGLRLDEGCGWGRSCTRPSVRLPGGYQQSTALATTYRTSAKKTLASIPSRSIWTITPKQLSSDLQKRGSAYALSNGASILASEQGALAYGWMRGLSSNPVAFNSSSRITQGLRSSQTAQDYRRAVRMALAQGQPLTVIEAVYRAGDPGLDNENFVRDAAAVADWANASNTDRSLAVIGSFALTAKVKQPGSGTATIEFVARNDMTLGSGLGFTPEGREMLNSLPGNSGPFSAVSQSFSWTEEISW